MWLGADRPPMTIDVDWGVKQQSKQTNINQSNVSVWWERGTSFFSEKDTSLVWYCL